MTSNLNQESITPTPAGVSPVSDVETLRGKIEPRIWTKPLRELTEYATYGYRLIEFAESIDEPFDPWQKWLAIHIGELLPDGRPRFRVLLILVARQMGKTKFAKIWILFNLFVYMPNRYRDDPLLGAFSGKLEYAKRTWQSVVNTAQRVPMLAAEVPRNGVKSGNNEVLLSTVHGTQYSIAAANEDCFRSQSLPRLYADEIRRLKDFVAWEAAEPTTSSFRDAQILATSNQGDDMAVVLDSLRNPALTFIETGVGDPSLGLFEWSSPDGADPTDVNALLQACPNAGWRTPIEPLLNRAARAKEAGGKQLASFKTEYMCMRVHNLDPAIDPERWNDCGQPASMDGLRDRIGCVLDVSPDQTSAILVAGALQPDGRVRLEVVNQWSGRGCVAAVRRELGAELQRVKPRAFGWFPIGPAASLQADLSDPVKAKANRSRRRGVWPPPGVQLIELTAETAAVCMGFSEAVDALDIVHSDDPLLGLHVKSAQKLWISSRWVFGRPGTMPINGAYAAAGSWWLARTLPAPAARRRLLVAGGS